MEAMGSADSAALEGVSRLWWLWLAIGMGVINIVRAFQVRSLGKLI